MFVYAIGQHRIDDLCIFCGTVCHSAMLMASKIGPEPKWAVEPAEQMLSQIGWIAALIEASMKSGELNKRAALWTAIAVLLGTISSVLSNWR